jgi:RNA polymerase sigma-70 factor, ECF subfamily
VHLQQYVTRSRRGRLKQREMSQPKDRTEDGLLRLALAGNEEAFRLLYARNHPVIYRFALHMSGNPATAEDVTQEVFMALIHNGKSFDPARGTLGGFLFGIARNQLRKRWEKEQRLVPLPEEFEETQVDRFSDPASFETVARVRQAVGSLPEGYREAVVLCDLEGMSYEEAAVALECPVGTVRSRLHRGRALLLEKLRERRPLIRASAVGE